MEAEIELTRSGDDAAYPRTIVIHLIDTPVQLAAMVGPVGLPVAARSAPPRPPVRITDKDILAVECLEARAVGVRVIGPCLVPVRFEVGPAAETLRGLLVLFALSQLLLLLDRARAQRDDAGVELNHDVDANVGDDSEQQKDGGEDDEECGDARVASVVEVVVHCKSEGR